jgi:hypothetical protein
VHFGVVFIHTGCAKHACREIDKNVGHRVEGQLAKLGESFKVILPLSHDLSLHKRSFKELKLAQQLVLVLKFLKGAPFEQDLLEDSLGARLDLFMACFKQLGLSLR